MTGRCRLSTPLALLNAGPASPRYRFGLIGSGLPPRRRPAVSVVWEGVVDGLGTSLPLRPPTIRASDVCRSFGRGASKSSGTSKSLMEQPIEILPCPPADLFEALSRLPGQPLGDLHHVGGAVRLATVRDRGEVARISFHEGAIRRQEGDHLADVVGLGEGDHAGEAQVVAALDQLPAHGDAAR